MAKEHDALVRDHSVVPAPLGNRRWSYIAAQGNSINRRCWLRECRQLARDRDFVEPDIELCPYCENLDPQTAELFDTISEGV